MAEIVHDGHLGLDFKREIPSICILADQEKLRPMRQAARQEFDHQFTADVNHHRLAAF
jgi:hypothetical protein